MSPIVFYFPYPSVGGVSVLFLRFASELATTREIILMDLPNGYMAQHLPDNCRFIPYDQPQLIPTDAIVIFQSIPFWRIKNISMFPASARVLFWNLHPDNLNPQLISSNPRTTWLKPWTSWINQFARFRKRKLQNTGRLLLSKHALVFMDQENRRATNKSLSIDVADAEYLPITTSPVHLIHTPSSPDLSQKIKCAWLGRLEGFKVPILLHTLMRLDQITSVHLIFDVIGDGIEKDVVVEYANKLHNVEINFFDNIPYQQIEETLVNYHLLFAMGTSALEGAKLGIPTFCLDYSYKPIEGLYRFRLLRNCIGYNVAECIDSRHIESSSTLEAQVLDVLQNFQQESEFVYDYWLSNHSPQSVVNRFLILIEKCELTFHNVFTQKLHEMDFVTRLIIKLDNRKLDPSGFVNR